MLARLGRRAVLSHEQAASRLGIELVSDAVPRVTVPRNHSRVAVPGWRVHRSDVPGTDVEHALDGTRVTGVVRTICDLARVLPLDEAVAAADSALRQGLVSQRPLVAVLLGGQGRGAAAQRTVGLLADGRSGSVLESLLVVALWAAGLPRGIPQYEVLDERGLLVARVDLCWPAQRLIVEADGFAFHSDRLAYRQDRQRLNELERLGWRVLRFTWEDVRGRPQAVGALVAQCLQPRAA